MESWQMVWRAGVVPALGVDGLEALEKALEADDPRLCQGESCIDDSGTRSEVDDVAAACAIVYVGWVTGAVKTVGDAEEFFALMCFEIDRRLGEPAACRWFLNWFDETPREDMRLALLAEIGINLRLLRDQSKMEVCDDRVENGVA